MKKLHAIIIPIILSNPFHVYSKRIFDECFLATSNLQTDLKRDLCLSNNNLMQPILINIDQNLNDDNIEFINNIKDQLFHKPGSSYIEKTNYKGRKNSNVETTLTFRQKTKSKNGEKQSPKGSSNATNPENLENFEKAGISIDPMRDSRQKPHSHNSWRWDKDKDRWVLVGQPKILVKDTGKVLSESEWNHIVRTSKKI
uniref:hypothetical protein n=1 Tax=Gracilaria cliftonii TaxID=206548 RepID=UPI001D1004EA|nr:hypothetical protein LKZ11_pgp104 [Gracilaria cliftonii]UAD84579.1 hypothetical protein [Gracilaria cliftonii]